MRIVLCYPVGEKHIDQILVAAPDFEVVKVYRDTALCRGVRDQLAGGVWIRSLKTISMIRSRLRPAVGFDSTGPRSGHVFHAYRRSSDRDLIVRTTKRGKGFYWRDGHHGDCGIQPVGVGPTAHQRSAC